MLNTVLGHAGAAPAPHDLWRAWSVHPLLVAALALAAWCYGTGRRRARDRPGPGPSRGAGPRTWRAVCFWAGWASVVVTLLSPLDAASKALASAHMVQHVLLVLVAAPLLACSRPASTLRRGSPPAVRLALARLEAGLHLSRRLRRARRPWAAWLAHVAVLWWWHASGPYDAALASEAVHSAEHATFLVTGVVFWSVVLGARAPGRADGIGLLLVFTMAMQSVFLSALITFARTPWYRSYATTTRTWGLEPLDDQQLAGAIMWIPAGTVYVGVGLALVVAWLRASERLDAVA